MPGGSTQEASFLYDIYLDDEDLQAFMASVDVKGAFPNTPHRLIEEVWRQLGLPYGDFVERYLRSRRYTVATGRRCTEWVTPGSGVPQGGVEGPFLYLLAMLPLMSWIAREYPQLASAPHTSPAQAYVDDAVPMARDEKAQQVVQDMMQRYGRDNHLVWGAEKSAVGRRGGEYRTDNQRAVYRGVRELGIEDGVQEYGIGRHRVYCHYPWEVVRILEPTEERVVPFLDGSGVEGQPPMAGAAAVRVKGVGQVTESVVEKIVYRAASHGEVQAVADVVGEMREDVREVWMVVDAKADMASLRRLATAGARASSSTRGSGGGRAERVLGGQGGTAGPLPQCAEAGIAAQKAADQKAAGNHGAGAGAGNNHEVVQT